MMPVIVRLWLEGSQQGNQPPRPGAARAGTNQGWSWGAGGGHSKETTRQGPGHPRREPHKAAAGGGGGHSREISSQGPGHPGEEPHKAGARGGGLGKQENNRPEQRGQGHQEPGPCKAGAGGGAGGG